MCECCKQQAKCDSGCEIVNMREPKSWMLLKGQGDYNLIVHISPSIYVHARLKNTKILEFGLVILSL